MSTEIRQAETLTEEEKQHLFNWGEDIFGALSLKLHWRPKELHFLIYDDGQAMSHVGILRHVVKVGGQLATVGGVGGVVTRPEAQGKGYASLLMRQTAAFMEREWQADAGLLFCFDRLMPLYESLGWQLVKEPVTVEQPSGQQLAPLNVMVLPLGGKAWPGGAIELCSHPW